MQQRKGNAPEHPNVRLEKLPFFDVIATLLEPTAFIPKPNPANWQQDVYLFHFTQQQVIEIANNR